MRSDRKTRRDHNHHATIRDIDAIAFLQAVHIQAIQRQDLRGNGTDWIGMKDTSRSYVPVVDARTARTVAGLLRYGFVSARRMASALNAPFEDIDATFVHHGIPYRLFR